MLVKFSGFFSEFKTRDIVPIAVQKNDNDVVTYVVPIGETWTVESVDFPNQTITGSCITQCKGVEPQKILHEFNFEDVVIEMSRNAVFTPANSKAVEDLAATLYSALDNLLNYGDARKEFIKAIMEIFYKHAPKVKSYAAWVDKC